MTSNKGSNSGDNNNNNIKALNVEYTGLRSNEILLGIQQQSQGCMIEIRFADNIIVPPKTGRVNELLNDGQNAMKLRDNFHTIPFFTSMTVQERKQWLENHSKEKVLFFQQYAGCEIRFLRMGGKVMIDQVTEEDRRLLMQGQFHSINEIIKMIKPKNPGSKAAATTMLFRADNWKIVPPNLPSNSISLSNEVKNKLPKLYLPNEIPSSLLSTSAPSKKNELLIKTEKQKNKETNKNIIQTSDTINKPKKEFLLEYERNEKSNSNAFQLLVEFDEDDSRSHDAKSFLETIAQWKGYSKEEFQEIAAALDWFSPAHLKSLLQKLIRFGAREVAIPTFSIVPIILSTINEMNSPNEPPKNNGYEVSVSYKTYKSEYVLIVVFVTLLCSAGSFVPDIQEYVTGRVSAYKRLGIIIGEDSFSDNPQCIECLFAAALLTKEDRLISPTIGWVLQCIEWLENALHESRIFMYDRGTNIQYAAINNNALEGNLSKKSNVKKSRSHTANEVDQVKETNDSSTIGSPWERLYPMICSLKSFEGDLKLFADIAKYHGKQGILRLDDFHNELTRPEVMNMEWTLDQHCAVAIAYYFPYSWLLNSNSQEKSDDNNIDENCDFAALFRYLWEQGTSRNFRIPKSYQCAVVPEDILKAQRLLWFSYQCTYSVHQRDLSAVVFPFAKDKYIHLKSLLTNQTITVDNLVIPYSFLAGLLGKMEVSILNTAISSCKLKKVKTADDQQSRTLLSGPKKKRRTTELQEDREDNEGEVSGSDIDIKEDDYEVEEKELFRKRRMLVWVMLEPEDSNSFVVIQAPCRDREAKPLEDEVKEEAIQIQMNVLETSGVLVHSKLLQLPVGTKIYLQSSPESSSSETAVDDSLPFVIEYADKLQDHVSWKSFCVQRRLLQIKEELPSSTAAALGALSLESIVYSAHSWRRSCHDDKEHIETTRDADLYQCIEKDAFVILEEYLSSDRFGITDAILARAMVYIRPWRSTIAMMNISRSGEGVQGAVYWTDVGVFHLFLRLCILFPSAIQVISVSEFQIVDLWLWGKIRKTVMQKWKCRELTRYAASMKDEEVMQWQGGNDERELKAHQIAAVEKLWYRMESIGHRGHILWMTVGSGKTLVVSTILARRIRAKTMPKYCIYVLPSSATETVKLEMLQGKYPVCWVLRPSQLSQHQSSREMTIDETDNIDNDENKGKTKRKKRIVNQPLFLRMIKMQCCHLIKSYSLNTMFCDLVWIKYDLSFLNVSSSSMNSI